MIWLESLFRDLWPRFATGEEAVPERFHFIQELPSFYLSCNLVVQVFVNNERRPRFVVKIGVPELGSKSFDREYRNLARLSEFPPLQASIPRAYPVIHWGTWSLLVQTALEGQPIDSRALRRRSWRQQIVDCTLNWLTQFHTLTSRPAASRSGRLRQLIEEPLETIRARLAQSKEIDQLVLRAQELTAPLRDADLPLVFSHGDFNGANILTSCNEQIRVIDWEHGKTDGLPLADLLMFLEFLRFATSASGSFGYQPSNLSDRELIGAYCLKLGIPCATIQPLSLASWTALLAERVEKCAEIDGTVEGGMALPAASTAWVLQDRYFGIWKQLVTEMKGRNLPPLEGLGNDRPANRIHLTERGTSSKLKRT